MLQSQSTERNCILERTGEAGMETVVGFAVSCIESSARHGSRWYRMNMA
jgi:hypothetical protein